ncbi:Basic-leucine zipper [Gracilaria domingensis]|nr:Basic-leucine zipper [Gracilaria domingensis]
MTVYMGTFRGTATLTLCSNGALVFSSTYSSCSFLSFYQDPHIKRELIEWALKYVSQQDEINPLKLVMAEAAGMKSRFVTATDTFLLASIAESILSKPIHFDQPPTSSRRDLPLSVPLADTSMEALMDSLEPSTGMGAGFGTAITHLNALSKDPELQQLLSDQRSLNSNTLLSDSSESVSFETLLDTTTAPQNARVSYADTGKESSVSSHSGNDTGSHSKRKLAVLAPAPATQGSLSGAEKTKNQIDEERRKRIELRKARNRESAQRSNLRKKMQLQHLKDELEAAAAKEAYLRAKEKTLREENMRLRTAVMR